GRTRASGPSGLSAHGQVEADRRPKRLPASQERPRRARPDPQRRAHQAGAGADTAVRMRRAAATFPILLLASVPAAAQQLDLGQLAAPAGGTTVATVTQLFRLLTALSVVPGNLIMVRSLTQFVMACSILHAGVGLPTAPANLTLVS